MSWQWPKTDRAGLARYVLSEAAQEFDLGISRNDLSQDANGRRLLVDAIYFSLQSKQFRYALEKYNPDDAVQLIRSPDEMLKQKEGTCLDLALLFCGVCLGYELLPLMILIEGHALAAVSLNYDLRSRNAFDRRERRYFEDAILTDVANLRQMVTGGSYVGVECTGFARTEKLSTTHPEGVGRDFRKLLPFQRALEAGQEQLNQPDRNFMFALDVAAAHDLGFRPGTQTGAGPEARAQSTKEINVGVRIDAAGEVLGERRGGIDSTQVLAQPVFVTRQDDVSETFELVVTDEFHSGGLVPRLGSSPKFAQVFASYGGARAMSVMRLRADKGEEKTRFVDIIRMHERIKAYTNREEGSLPDDDEMIMFGGELFDTLFQGDVRRLYDEARIRKRGRLDIMLTSMIPWIAEKPWEFSYDHGRNSFIATEMHFIRNVVTKAPADAITRSDGPLRILVVSAQPVGFGRLSIEQELAVIQRGFDPLVEAGLVTIDTLARATPSMIQGRLTTGNYQIVHFIGHGMYNEVKGEGCLIFVNEQGGEYPYGERSLRDIFCGRGLSLVFLSGCESGRGGAADFNKGVAQSLVACGLPALVANQYSVLDSSATSFAQHFYWSLAQGMSLGRAAREARIAVNHLLHGESIDWAVPVLYARDANATLCTPAATTLAVPTTSVRASMRRSTIAHPTRVGVWDMDNVFPSLDQTLAKMNKAQKVFGFELVGLSVPLGVWDLSSKKGEPYLWAERLAYRLQRMPMELGVEVLACVTRHSMRSDEWLNLYGWWPDQRSPPIIIFAIAGLEELSPEGPDTDRALANTVVAGLAGFYGEVASHQRGAQACPLAFNESRDFKQLVTRQKFDASCRKKLKAKLGSRFDALEALLKTFPAAVI